jgi:glycosyltransferase involved in cell wall biosynthesis
VPTISYAVTVCDELEELRRLLPILHKYLGADDEIVIQYDAPRTPPAVLDFLESLAGEAGAPMIVPFALNDDFAAFKNNLKAHCRGDYIFQIDADEYPSDILLSRLRGVLHDNPTVDVLLVPRINTVRGLTPEHVRKWGWHVNAQGWVNFPDPQTRIYRNSDAIVWKNRVHERLTGAKVQAELPAAPEFSLMHPKDIARQERQNLYYETLG